MFEQMKRFHTSNDVKAPVNGACIDITEVAHPVFAEKMMGDGFAVIPSSNVICAPCSGELSMVFATGHAFGITRSDHEEILVHIGIETVNLKGRGFTILKAQNERVTAGEPVIEIDRQALERDGYDVSTMVIITSRNDTPITKHRIHERVVVGDSIIKFGKAG